MHGIESARPSCPEGELTAPGVSDKIKPEADTLPMIRIISKEREKFMAITLFERWSPEYALNNAFDDMRESGLT
ncbi:MAG: hypothetical protein IJH21_03880, partial [Oscillospiraceae bacterium]|nr:hypothetical protein [Oscillospiraceae bacterium]